MTFRPVLWPRFTRLAATHTAVVGITFGGLMHPAGTPDRPIIQARQQFAEVFGKASPAQIELQVGVIQRFGRSPTDQIKIAALAGDRLTIRYQGSGSLTPSQNSSQNLNPNLSQPQTLVVPEITLKLQPQPLPQPRLEARAVLSTHRSFETAEEDAMKLQAQGVEVEIAQPERWQVWGKRDVYRDAAARHRLVAQVKQQGLLTAFVDSQVQQTQTQAVLQFPLLAASSGSGPGSSPVASPVPVPLARSAPLPDAPNSATAPVPETSVAKAAIAVAQIPIDQLEITTQQGQFSVTTNVGEDRPERTYRSLYVGQLRLQPNAYGNYTLVNQTPLETYLRGVVPHEIGTTTAQSVLESQAILARTYALRNLRRFAIDNYQICADTQCQVFYGLSETNPRTDAAIAATQGQVLTYNQELVDALYSSTTGGTTAAFNEVWTGPERPYLQARLDAVTPTWDLSRSLADEGNLRQFIAQTAGFNESGGQWFRWRQVATLPTLTRELQQLLKAKQHPLAAFKTIQAIAVTQRSASGRVQQMVVNTDLGPVELSKEMVLSAFEAPNSLLFYLDPILTQGKLTGYAFVGGGLGHGVGFSQTGAYKLGELGWSRDRILSFYFPGAQLQPLQGNLTLWQPSQ